MVNSAGKAASRKRPAGSPERKLRAGLPRRRLELDHRREKLLESGRELFSKRSYDEISIDDIARAAGISKGLLYHYYPTKREFYVGTIRAAAGEMLALLRADRPWN